MNDKEMKYCKETALSRQEYMIDWCRHAIERTEYELVNKKEEYEHYNKRLRIEKKYLEELQKELE